MPYARQDYKFQDIVLGFRAIDTNLTQGNVGGLVGGQPKPHAGLHGGDELHRHPLFAKARVTSGDGPGTHSVMDETQMMNALVGVFNDAGMQPFLQNVDAGQDAHVNVNLTNSPGTADVYKAKKGGGATAAQGAVVAFFLKIRPNPNNKEVPIIQTCVPHIAALQIKTKKGVVKGFVH